MLAPGEAAQGNSSHHHSSGCKQSPGFLLLNDAAVASCDGTMHCHADQLRVTAWGQPTAELPAEPAGLADLTQRWDPLQQSPPPSAEPSAGCV